jgi:RNA polymerase sigma-70 factor, ECF subfamily
MNQVSKLSDIDLAKQARSGDAATLRELYERTYPYVFRTVTRLLGAADPDREDLAQRTMLSLIENISSYRGTAPLQSFASGIAARVVYRQIRRRRLERKHMVQTDVADEYPNEQEHLGDQLVSRSTLARVRRVIERIDPDRSWAFLLHDVMGFQLEEIAPILSISVAAAQSRLVRGRALIYEELGREPELLERLTQAQRARAQARAEADEPASEAKQKKAESKKELSA